MLQTKDSKRTTSLDENLGTPALPRVADHSCEPNCGTHPREDYESHERAHIESSDMIRIAVTGAIAALVWFRVWEPLPRISLLGIAGVLFGGYPIFREAFENIRERRKSMELSMIIALVAALCIGAFFTALIITVFVLAAEVLAGLTVGRGRRAIGDLLELLLHSAWIVKNGNAIEVPVGEMRAGDRVLFRPGTRIPVDGSRCFRKFQRGGSPYYR